MFWNINSGEIDGCFRRMNNLMGENQMIRKRLDRQSDSHALIFVPLVLFGHINLVAHSN